MSGDGRPQPGGVRGLAPDERTLPTLLGLQAERWGDKPLVRVGDAQLSYREALERAKGVAAMLAHAGVRPGDRVAAMCANRIELLELMFGCAWLGAPAVPLNTAARGRQLEHALTNSGARMLLIDAALAKRLEAFPRPPSLERVWILDDEGEHPAGYPAEPAPQPAAGTVASDVHPPDIALILYTSGTTGPAKGVCISQAQLYWWGVNIVDMLTLSASDVLFNPLPLYHINALTTPLQALASGGSAVIPERFSASRFWEQARTAEATVAYVLGAMVTILARRPEDPGDRAHRVDRALAPGAPAPLFEVFRRRFGVRLIEGYASTETNCVMGANLERPGMLGQVRDGFEARVVDEHDNPVPDGVPGELVLRHREPFAFSSGYFGMPEKTVEAWRNLWFHTGDLVIRTPDGWFKFVDRLSDSIRRRGENISSFDVEEAITSHPDVAAAAAFAVPSELGEDEVMVAVVPRPGATLEPLDLIRHCETHLAYFAIPRYVDIMPELPLTETGKPRKVELRERGVTETTWDRETAGYELSRD